MHEMAIAMSLLEVAEAEARKRGCAHISRLTVHYGQISGIMPEALELAFQVLTSAGPHANAELTLVMIPLKLKCAFCNTEFSGQESAFSPCPACGEEFGHSVIEGKELLLAHLEAC